MKAEGYDIHGFDDLPCGGGAGAKRPGGGGGAPPAHILVQANFFDRNVKSVNKPHLGVMEV